MNIKQFQSTLNKYIKAIETRREEIVLVAAISTLAEMQNRIFNFGLNSKNMLIGKYSRKPIYVKSPYPQVKNKNLKKIGKTGKKTKKTAYFAKGYWEFRQKAGRPNKFVNLDLTGSLRLSMVVGRYRRGYAIGFNSKRSYLIMKGNEERFGGSKIAKLSAKERTHYDNEIVKHLQRITDVI